MVFSLSFFIPFVITIAVLFLILKILSLPMKLVFKLIINGIIGGIILFVINLIGAHFGFALLIEWWTAVIVGALGIPGVIIVIILTFLL